MSDEIVDVLSDCTGLLEGGGTESEYLATLKDLSSCLTADENSLSSIANDGCTLNKCADILSISLLVSFKNENEQILYIRLLRGLIILTRNLVAHSSSTLDVPLILLNIQHFHTKIPNTAPFFHKCLVSYLELLANIALKGGVNFRCNFLLVCDTFNEEMLKTITSFDDHSLTTPFLIFLNACLEEEDNVSMLLRDRISYPVLHYLLENGFSLEACELRTDTLIMEIFQKIISNKAFGSWIESKEREPTFQKVLGLTQRIATSKDDWSNQDCMSIMSTIFELTRRFAREAIQLLHDPINEEVQIKKIQAQLVSVLDIVSDLCKFHCVKQFLEHYDGLEVLIPLLRAIHENTDVVNIKRKVGNNPLQKGSKTFPMAKSLIIEILTFICHDSKTAQDKMRSLRGLELVLSNCVIDESNPFLKERSILCIKFLLKDNPENQKFVQELEAKQVVDDDALRDAGYEVNIEDGKVKVKKN